MKVVTKTRRNKRYESNRMSLKSTHVPNPTAPPNPLKSEARALLRVMLSSEDDFHPDQYEAIERLVAGRRRVLLVQRTGWGKSFVYFIATALLRKRGAGPALLISPLLSLMRNQIETARRAGVKAYTINCTKNLVTEAKAFLDAQIIKIEPRKRWPAGTMKRSLTIPEDLRIYEGRALSHYADPGFGKKVQHGKYRDGRFDDVLVEAAVRLVRAKWEPPPEVRLHGSCSGPVTSRSWNAEA